MYSDKPYAPTALVHRGHFAEEVTAKLTTRVFGAKGVYRNVEIREKKGHAITDIDVLAIVGNKAIAFQVKAKRLTEVAKLGNEADLQGDFKAAVQHAYDQGLLSRKALLDHKNALFVEGKEIELSESLDEVYLVCVTLDHYPAVTHQVSVYLRRNQSDPLPIAISIFDLDILTYYLPDPFEFAYYLRQRTDLSDYFQS
jgi:hypothetical protein